MILIALGLVMLASGTVLLCLAFTAPAGWEGPDGFHPGTEPPRLPRTEAQQHDRGAAVGFYQINEHGQSDTTGGERNHGF